MPRREGVAANGRKWIYGGDVDDNNRHGFGICWWENGDRFEGQWLADRTGGFGVYYQSDGAHYKGQFKDHKMDGLGVCMFPDGDKNEGEWRDGVFFREAPIPPQIIASALTAAEHAKFKFALDYLPAQAAASAQVPADLSGLQT
eukprot:m.233314 g.233314  ORF g.233314 m.233314 type:complete len:144 (-) comp12492_c0_seq1:253-684(-)